MAKQMLRIGDILGRGDSRLVVVGVDKVRIDRRSMGVVYTVQRHEPVNGSVVDGNAYTMIGGTETVHESVGSDVVLSEIRGAEVRTTRSAIKMGGWKLIAGPTFDARATAAKEDAARAAIAGAE
jgi:hypothetical protein